jgi:hypothetical protein
MSKYARSLGATHRRRARGARGISCGGSPQMIYGRVGLWSAVVSLIDFVSERISTYREGRCSCRRASCLTLISRMYTEQMHAIGLVVRLSPHTHRPALFAALRSRLHQIEPSPKRARHACARYRPHSRSPAALMYHNTLSLIYNNSN